MPIIKTYTLYTFDELSDRAKEKARDWYRTDNDDDFMLSESFAQTLSYYGFPEGSMKIYHSLAYCQGDGVAFEGPINFDALLATTESELHDAHGDDNLVVIRELIKEARAHDIDLTGKVENNGSFHECSMDIELDCYYISSGNYFIHESANDKVISARDQIAAKVQKALEAFVTDLSLKLTKDGYSELDYQYSDEVVDERIIANEYTFCEDGKREN